MNTFKWIATYSVVAAIAACGSSTPNTGTGVVPADSSGGGADSGQAAGDSTKNKADVKVAVAGGAAVEIKGEKAASKDDATAKTWGATNADAVVNMFITEAGGTESKVITIFVDSAKHPLPATGIPVGAINSDAWVTYTVASPALTGTFSSKDKGTIDVSPCPAEGKALVGTLKGVVLYNETPVGPATVTLDGTFNLVFFGGAGAVKCAEVPKETDAGSTAKDSGGAANDHPFNPPKGSTCDANVCDGGSNTTRMCCPFGKCIGDCHLACADDVEKCTTACDATDFGCTMGCVGTMVSCIEGCPDKCGATADCKAKIADIGTCQETNSEKCDADDMTEEQSDICFADACCAELKAAF